jgi:hypothetical protein
MQASITDRTAGALNQQQGIICTDHYLSSQGQHQVQYTPTRARQTILSEQTLMGAEGAKLKKIHSSFWDQSERP